MSNIENLKKIYPQLLSAVLVSSYEGQHSILCKIKIDNPSSPLDIYCENGTAVETKGQLVFQNKNIPSSCLKCPIFTSQP